MEFSIVLLKLIEQILSYIAGFGLSEMLIRYCKPSKTMELMYYIFCGIIAIYLLYITKDY